MEGWRKGTSHCLGQSRLVFRGQASCSFPSRGPLPGRMMSRKQFPAGRPAGPLAQNTGVLQEVVTSVAFFQPEFHQLHVPTSDCENYSKEGSVHLPRLSVLKSLHVCGRVCPSRWPSFSSLLPGPAPTFPLHPHTRNANRVTPSLGQAVPGTRARPG